MLPCGNGKVRIRRKKQREVGSSPQQGRFTPEELASSWQPKGASTSWYCSMLFERPPVFAGMLTDYQL